MEDRAKMVKKFHLQNVRCCRTDLSRVSRGWRVTAARRRSPHFFSGRGGRVLGVAGGAGAVRRSRPEVAVHNVLAKALQLRGHEAACAAGPAAEGGARRTEHLRRIRAPIP